MRPPENSSGNTMMSEFHFTCCPCFNEAAGKLQRKLLPGIVQHYDIQKLQ